MNKFIQNLRKPSIMTGQTDQKRLNKLVLAAADRLPEISNDLLIEFERASMISDSTVPGNLVRMGSTVEYETEPEAGEQ